MRNILKCRWFINIILLVIQIANMFLSNIIMHEVTTGIEFKWNDLWHNKWFWILVLIILVYNLISYNIIKDDRKENEAIVKAIEDKKIELINSLNVKNKHTQKETFKLINRLDKMKRW